MTEISSLYAKLGFIVDDKGLKDFKEALESLKKALSKYGLKESMDSFKIEKEKLQLEKIRSQIRKADADAELKHQKAIIQASREERLRAKEDRLHRNSSFSAFLGNLGVAVAKVKQLKKSMDDSISTGVGLTNFSYVTGLQTNELRRLQYLMGRGGTVLGREDVSSMVQNLQQEMIKIRLGQGNITPFTMLGVGAYGQNPYRVLEDISKSIKNIDNATAKAALTQLGLGHPDMLRMLRGELAGGRFGSAAMLSDYEAGALTEIGRGWRALEFSLKNFKDRFFAQFDNLSAFAKDIADTIDWLNINIMPAINKIEGILGHILGFMMGFFSGGNSESSVPFSIGGAMSKGIQGVRQLFDKATAWNLPETPLYMNANDTRGIAEYYMEKAMDDGKMSRGEYNSIRNYIVNMEKNPDLRQNLVDVLDDLSEYAYTNSSFVNSQVGEM